MSTCLRQEDITSFKSFLFGIGVMCVVTGSHTGKFGTSQSTTVRCRAVQPLVIGGS
jgi:hypothetical protein